MPRSKKKFEYNFNSPLNIEKIKENFNIEENKNKLFKYIDLCKIFEQPIKSSGRGRIDQIRFWSNFINIQLVGRKYRIIEIYDTPLKSLDELYNFLQKRPEFLVPFESRKASGIYKIYNDDYIYFGSTIDFRERFMEHFNNYSNIKNTQIISNILHNNGFFDMVDQCILTDRDKSKDITFINDSPLSISLDKRLQNINDNSSFNEDNIRICSCKTMRELELYYIHKYYLEQIQHDFKPPYHRKLLNSIGITMCKRDKQKQQKQNNNKKISISVPLGFLNENPTIKQLYLDFINTLKSNINSLNMTEEQIDDFFKNYTKNFDIIKDDLSYE